MGVYQFIKQRIRVKRTCQLQCIKNVRKSVDLYIFKFNFKDEKPIADKN